MSVKYRKLGKRLHLHDLAPDCSTLLLKAGDLVEGQYYGKAVGGTLAHLRRTALAKSKFARHRALGQDYGHVRSRIPRSCWSSLPLRGSSRLFTARISSSGPRALPGALGTEKNDIPTLRIFPSPKNAAAPHPAVLLIPGGGYKHLSGYGEYQKILCQAPRSFLRSEVPPSRSRVSTPRPVTGCPAGRCHSSSKREEVEPRSQAHPRRGIFLRGARGFHAGNPLQPRRPKGHRSRRAFQFTPRHARSLLSGDHHERSCSPSIGSSPPRSLIQQRN